MVTIKPRMIIDALISRVYRKQPVYLSDKDTSFNRDCNDMLTRLYNEDFESVRIIVATLQELGFFKANTDGTFSINNRLREFLIAASE